ncbi:MAG: methionine adenosyltransferase [Acidimicrobiia bacterium]|nr:methionine adenosyltransferase [Acidimicrobiia bacterium]
MITTYFSSESVTEGHPDKVADAISDAVLDAVLTEDDRGKVAAETLVTTKRAIVAGEVHTDSSRFGNDELGKTIDEIVRTTVDGLGYNFGNFAAESIDVDVLIHPQSVEIRDGVERGDDPKMLGAGDQGIMFGYAVDHTDELMPLPIQLAHRMAERLATVRKIGLLPYLRPDGKTQVTVRFEDDQPVAITDVLISTQHIEEMSQDEMRGDVLEQVVHHVLPADMLAPDHRFLFNPSGSFVSGGPHADAGVTGRKIIVDTYGGYARHGGGAFSGKDPSKVDRSAAYGARWAAKNVVAAGLATECEVQLAYAIGDPEPFSVRVETFGSALVDPDKIVTAVKEVFDFRPGMIIEDLGLRAPIYQPTTAYGHFGRAGFPWEETNRAEALRSVANA